MRGHLLGTLARTSSTLALAALFIAPGIAAAQTGDTAVNAQPGATEGTAGSTAQQTGQDPVEDGAEITVTGIRAPELIGKDPSPLAVM